MIQILATFLIGLVIGYAVAYAFQHRREIKHRWSYKRYKLPCPVCRDESGKPTGYIRPSNPYLQAELGNEPTFPCSRCDGKKYIVHETRRGEKVEIDEEGRIVGTAQRQRR